LSLASEARSKHRFADPQFAGLAARMRSRRSERRDGISGEAFGMTDVLSFFGNAAIPALGYGSSAVPALLITAEDYVSDWRSAPARPYRACY
jgi:hypothetical protein